MVNFEELLLIQSETISCKKLLRVSNNIFANRKPLVFGRIKVLFTGYIFNSKSFNSSFSSPEELIAHTYINYAPEKAIELIEGYFAAIIIDQGKITIWTDKYGIESGFYHHNPKTSSFIFSSSLNLIKDFYSLTVDANILPFYFIFTELPRGKTFFNGLNKTKRAEYVVMTNNKIKLGNYSYLQKLTNGLSTNNRKSDSAIDEEIVNLFHRNFLSLKESFPEYALVNQLSGGLDSTYFQTILAEMGETQSYCNNIKHFGLDATYSKDIARILHCDHKVFEIPVEDISMYMDNAMKDILTASVFIGEAMLNYSFHNLNKNEPFICMSGNGADSVFGYSAQLKILKLFEINLKFLYPAFGSFSRANKHLEIIKYVGLNESTLHPEIARIGYASNAFLDVFSERLTENALAVKTESLKQYPGRLIDRIYVSRIFESRGGSWQNPIIYKMAKQNKIVMYFALANEDILQYLIGIPIERKLKGFSNKYFVKYRLKQMIPKEFIFREKIGKNPPWDDILNFNENFNNQICDFYGGLFDDQSLNLDKVSARLKSEGNERFKLKLANVYKLSNIL